MIPKRFASMKRIALLFPLLLLAGPAAAREVDGNMTFSLKGWSAFYKTQSGTGTITCHNGQKMRVKITAKGGGLTFGKSSIENGKGEFRKKSRNTYTGAIIGNAVDDDNGAAKGAPIGAGV